MCGVSYIMNAFDPSVNWEGLASYLGRPLEEVRKDSKEDLLVRIRASREFPTLLGMLQATLADVNEYGSDDLALRDVLADVVTLLKG